MGGIISCDKKPVLEQPKLFGNFPDPDPIWSIAPTLMFYTESLPRARQNDDELIVEPGEEVESDQKRHANPVATVNHDQTPEEAVNRIGHCFSNPKRQRLVVITHGFRSDKDSQWLHDAKDAILATTDQIPVSGQVVAILGWGGGADIGLFNYSQAASNCLETGRWLGRFLKAFRQQYPNISIYGIGHSLGAHLMGAAGRTSDGAIDRITGLDPAGVGFQTENEEKRLSPKDAKLVDVIHTDGQDVPYFGTLVPLGHLDFYPNYGWDQPSNDGQPTAKPMIQRDKNQRKVPIPSEYGGFISESHGRSIDFFMWSIQNQGCFRTHLKLDGKPDVESGVHRIAATSIDSGIMVEMGYHLDTFLDQLIVNGCLGSTVSQSIPSGQQASNYIKYYGNYYVHTNGQAPWC